MIIRTMANWYAGAPTAKALPSATKAEILPFPSAQAARVGR